jgi:hypothetical protein
MADSMKTLMTAHMMVRSTMQARAVARTPRKPGHIMALMKPAASTARRICGKTADDERVWNSVEGGWIR